MSNYPTFPNLVCCGGDPYACQNFQNVSLCPENMDPQFCCTATGQIVPASVSMDQYGDDITVCPNYGTVPYNSYDPGVCQQSPVYNCCNNGNCYQSKDPDCNYYGTADVTIGGAYVSDCSQCSAGSFVGCCFPGQMCQLNPKATGCPREAVQMADCSSCVTDDDFLSLKKKRFHISKHRLHKQHKHRLVKRR